MKKHIAAVAFLGLLGCTGLRADILNFEQSPWTGATGNTSFSQSLTGSNGIPYTVTLTTNIGTLSSGSQGIGIRSSRSDTDEVENPEVLTVSFSLPTIVSSFRVEKLFGFEFEPFLLPNVEVGQYSVDGLTWTNFTGIAFLVGDGGLSVNVGSSPITAIRFTSTSDRDEFSLNQLDVLPNVVPTPEPASILLFGLVATTAVTVLKKRIAKS